MCLYTYMHVTGMEDHDRLRPAQYHGANVFLVCFSVVFPGSLDSVKEKVDMYLHLYINIYRLYIHVIITH